MTAPLITFRADMRMQWLEMARWRDLLGHTIENHDGGDPDSLDRLLTVSEAVLARLDAFIILLDKEFAE